MTVSSGVASTTSDTELQGSSTSTTPARFNQWYSFGAAHTVQYRVGGTTATTAQYSADITQRIVTPTNLGTVQFGALTIATESALADTELFVYDSAFNLVYLNDDDNATTESSVNATLANGQTYYIGVGRYNSATSTINTLAGSGGVAGDFLTGSVHANSGLITSASTSTTSSSFDLLFGSTVVGNGAWTGISDAYKVHWYTVQAVPEPGTMLALAAGLSAIAARRRRKS
ncbi:MAG: PEP-CTERM sorting domain-containing protein [Armatimonadetes bacterium]|nr:PEP-CTERM sorting domain-containing protein [Armatimonadota bacterium]